MAALPELRAELDRIAGIVVDRAMFIHRTPGPGLLESAYVRILVEELTRAGLHVATEVDVPLTWRGKKLGVAYRADIIVEGKLIIEVKAVEKHSDLFARQLLTYLIVMDYRLGLLINFGGKLLKDGLERVANKF